MPYPAHIQRYGWLPPYPWHDNYWTVYKKPVLRVSDPVVQAERDRVARERAIARVLAEEDNATMERTPPTARDAADMSPPLDPRNNKERKDSGTAVRASPSTTSTDQKSHMLSQSSTDSAIDIPAFSDTRQVEATTHSLNSDGNAWSAFFDMFEMQDTPENDDAGPVRTNNATTRPQNIDQALSQRSVEAVAPSTENIESTELDEVVNTPPLGMRFYGPLYSHLNKDDKAGYLAIHTTDPATHASKIGPATSQPLTERVTLPAQNPASSATRTAKTATNERAFDQHCATLLRGVPGFEAAAAECAARVALRYAGAATADLPSKYGGTVVHHFGARHEPSVQFTAAQSKRESKRLKRRRYKANRARKDGLEYAAYCLEVEQDKWEEYRECEAELGVWVPEMESLNDLVW